MKLILIAILLAGCSSLPPPVPLTVDYEGRRYFSFMEPIEGLKQGDLVAFRGQGQIIAGRITDVRGKGVYRVEGDGLILVHAGNYMAHLIPLPK